MTVGLAWAGLTGTGPGLMSSLTISLYFLGWSGCDSSQEGELQFGWGKK